MVSQAYNTAKREKKKARLYAIGKELEDEERREDIERAERLARAKFERWRDRCHKVKYDDKGAKPTDAQVFSVPGASPTDISYCTFNTL